MTAKKRPEKYRSWPCGHCDGVGLDVYPEGAWIRMIREEEELTLRGLAKQLGISPAYLCDIEHNRRRPNAAVMRWLDGEKP